MRTAIMSALFFLAVGLAHPADVPRVPDPPSDFKVKWHAGNIVLSWKAPSPPPSVGYNVYFRKGRDKKYIKVNLHPLKHDWWLLRGLQKESFAFMARSVEKTDPLVESKDSNESSLDVRYELPEIFRMGQHPEYDGIIDIYKLAGMEKWPKPSRSGIKYYTVYLALEPSGLYWIWRGVNPEKEDKLVLCGLESGKRYYFVFTTMGMDDRESGYLKEMSWVAVPGPKLRGPRPRYWYTP